VDGSARITPLQHQLLNELHFVRVEDTHTLARLCRCSIGGANNALMALHRMGQIGIEHAGKRGAGGHPTVWYAKTECVLPQPPNDQAEPLPPDSERGRHSKP